MRARIVQAALEHGLPVERRDAFAQIVSDILTGQGTGSSVLPTLLTLGDDGFAPIALDGDAPARDDDRPDHADERYEDLGPIGTGGMGEVRRVRDRALNRAVAMKRMHPALLHRPRARARFVEEAQATSQLQHPNIVPIHDIGAAPDGRVWFTMKEVRGRTLADVVREVHGASRHRWEQGPTGWTFRQVMGAFLLVCRAVGYAHERRVVHRDLKPDNVMLGDHGEVYVLDWGLAKVLGRPDAPPEEAAPDSVSTDRARSGSFATIVGTVSGTPAYMSPEQAQGRVDRIDARSDVYGLGATLFEVLTGRAPREDADVMAVLVRAAAGQAIPLPDDPKIPDELASVCRRAMAAAPEDRFGSASDLADEVQAWLDGARLREQALAVVEAAVAHGPEADRLRVAASTTDAEAVAMLAEVPRWAPEDDKAPAWAHQDHAAALRRQADAADLAVEQGLHGALRIDPGLPEAHAALAERFLARHAAAELARDPDAAARAQALLSLHVDALPADHPVRRRSVAYLAGDGALTLVTDPPGAEVVLYRYVAHNRRLVAEQVRSLGPTPIAQVSLESGSYLCVIRHPDRAEVRYPVAIGRGEHWHGVAPEGGDPHPVYLPGRDELAPDECYVPAGWYRSGGDVEAVDCGPRTRLWCDGLVMQRVPVTNRDYIAFLEDLVARGGEADALAFAPRKDDGGALGAGAMIYRRRADGRFELGEDSEGDQWLEDWPVMMVDLGCAVAYARWLAERTGRPWRIPGEWEWEKAARGVDGRWFPWGDAMDPSWCAMRESGPGRPVPFEVSRFPVDESVYGIRDLGGNVRDWCADTFVSEVSHRPDGRVVPPVLEGVVDMAAGSRRASRGGVWAGFPRLCRSALRWGSEPSSRYSTLGIRLVRSFPDRS